MTRRLILAALSGFALIVTVLVTRGDDNAYVIKTRMANASGLRDGSPVVIGGVPVGTVELHAHRDFIEANLKIDRQYGPIGKDAVAAITAQNVLGQKQVRMEIGNRSDPAGDGYRLPARQVRATTDLDQLLSTLDPDTRTRLAILINESGSAFAGRKMSFRTFMEYFAPALESGGTVLHQLAADNRALTHFVDVSDGFVAELATRRTDVTRVLDSVGRSAETVAAKRSELRSTLREAPAALRATRRFLGELQKAAAPLGETSRLLTATAPGLNQVLSRIGPFERDAGPAIRSLKAAGPIIHRTASTTTAPLRRLIPTTADLKALLQTEVPPAGKTLDGSVDNAFATIDNWAHAIQFRDGLGHVFRGEASVSPDLYESLIDRLTGGGAKSGARQSQGRKAKHVPAAQLPSTTPDPRVPEAKSPEHKLPPLLPKGTGTIQDILSPSSDQDGSGDGLKGLLDYLLGGGN